MAQEDKAALRARAQEIKNETAKKANTATRVGTMHENQNDSAINAVEDADQSLKSNFSTEKQIGNQGKVLSFTQTPNFDFNIGGNIQSMTIDNDLLTLSISNYLAAHNYKVYLKQNSTGGHAIPEPDSSFGTITDNSPVKANELSTVADSVNIITIQTTPETDRYYTIETVGGGNTWYVRPSGGSYGSEDGTSYDNAWDGFTNINWTATGVQPGDALVVAGTHNEVLTVGGSGTASRRITIKGNYSGDPGIVDSQDTRNVGIEVIDKNYITLISMTSIDAVVSCVDIRGTSSNILTYNLEISGSGNQGVQNQGTSSTTHYDIYAHDNVDNGVSGHDDATIVLNGGIFTNNNANIGIVANVQLTATGLTISGGTYSIIASGAGIVANVSNTLTDSAIQLSLGGDLSLTQCRITNSVTTLGGEVTLDRCTLTGNARGRITGSTGTLTLKNSAFINSTYTDHLIDGNVGAFNMTNCVFNFEAVGKNAIVIRSGTTHVINGCTFTSPTKGGTGLSIFEAATINNSIFTNLALGLFSGVGTDALFNCCFFANTTDKSGAISSTDEITTDPKLLDVANDDYSLDTGSSCIGTGKDLGATYEDGIDAADWGDSSNYPVVTIKKQGANWDIGAYIS